MMRMRLMGMAAVAVCAAAVGVWAAAPANPAPAVAPPGGAQDLPIPEGAPPFRAAGVTSGNPLYSPPSTSPAPNGKPGNAYWSLVIQSDPIDLKIYWQANKELGPPKEGEQRVVFLGDSITENWQKTFNTNFPGKTNYIGRGRTSETTLHMLGRFRSDVVNIQAKVLVLMAGVNDIAGNSGAVPDEQIHNNFSSIFDICEVNKIKVVLVSTLPATNFFWQPGLEPKERVADLVKWQKETAAKRGLYFVNAFDAFKDEQGGMPRKYSGDTVHPNAEGYKLLSGLVEPEIAKALKGEPPGK